jgi:serine/threonine protein kinase
MLFPYAQCNLREYMAWNKFQFRKEKETLWLLEQFKGLASALKLIHDLSNEDTLTPTQSPRLQALSPILPGERRAGWHHDLKPENILYFWDTDPPHGTFRISDWGSGRVNTYRSGRTVFTPSPNGTLTYEPPEVLYEGKTSRPYDVWSLGCVFLELLVWALWDFQAVKAFGNERIDRRDLCSASTLRDDAFWQRLEGGNVVLRQSVKNWISKLEDTLQQQEALMAAFEVVRDMLDPRRNIRISARDADETLGRICVQALVGLEDDNSADADRDPRVPRLSLKAPDRRTSDPASHSNSLSSRHMAPAFGDQVYASPIDMMSPYMRHSELSPSTASRSRQNSLASSVISLRDGRSGLSKANTPEPGEERK